MEAIWEGPGDGPSVGDGPLAPTVSDFLPLFFLPDVFLDRLYLAHNQLAAIPDCMASLSHLTGFVA